MDGSERTLDPRQPGQGSNSADGGSRPQGSAAEGSPAVVSGTGGPANALSATTGKAAPVAQADGSAFRILADSSLADERTRVLKHGDTFGVFDHYGDIKPEGLGEEGLFHDGTRFLSGLLLDLEGGRPSF